MLQGIVLGPLLFLLYMRDLPIMFVNTPVDYAHDSPLLAEVQIDRLSFTFPVINHSIIKILLQLLRF